MYDIRDHPEGLNTGNYHGGSPQKYHSSRKNKHMAWIGFAMAVQKTKFNILNYKFIALLAQIMVTYFLFKI